MSVRDYKKLTNDELVIWNDLEKDKLLARAGKFVFRKAEFDKYPKAVRHHMQLFPNHYLAPVELRNKKLLKATKDAFENLLSDSNSNERSILNFINVNRHFFVIGAILKKYFNFGHHATCLFREFPLGTSYKVDYLLIGRNSDGWHFVFVELEAPTGSITLANGDLGLAFRKGESQLQDWDYWLEEHRSSLQEFFSKRKKEGDQLPEEFCQIERSRVYFVVIAGLRDDFSSKTYRMQRVKSQESRTRLIHYDNLLDALEDLYNSVTY